MILRRNNVAGFSILEILVVVVLISVLLSLLVPGIQSARESARRAVCENNLKQVGVALLQYEAVNRSLPIGAERNISFGVSWWAGAIRHFDDSALTSALDFDSPHSGSVWLHPTNGRVADQVFIENLWCPSSPLPPLKQVVGVSIMMPSYVGIAGASSDQVFQEKRVSQCCVPEYQGEISAGGVLVPNAAISLRRITDGTSRTLAVAETSDFARDHYGKEYRIDGGNPNGWLTGTSANGTPPTYHLEQAPPSWNITTVRYGPNTRDYLLPGVDDNRGANNPFVSAHPGGIMSLAVDGAVHFLFDDTDITLLKRLATRDDGQAEL